MSSTTNLCASCAAISLPALIEAIPFPRRPQGGGSGIPNFFDYQIPKLLDFPARDSTQGECALCSLILSREREAKTFSPASTSKPLTLAGLCPPSRHSHPTSSNVVLLPGNNPQWHGFKGQENRVNKLEPMDKTTGYYMKTPEYTVYSPWQIHLAADDGTEAAKVITRRPIPTQGSTKSLNRLMGLIDECNSDHARCKLGVDGELLNDPPKLPTRVIDVGSPTQPPRLIISRSQKARYTTLSHCWAHQRWVATTLDTLPLMLDSFDPSQIPQTYADAIAVTRKLGIQYLWIDSFCIIQDDHADWEREAEMMGDVYEQAYCNIAATGATGAENGDTGFLYKRRSEPTFVRVPADLKSEEYFYFVSQPDSDFEGQVRQKRLNTRGWVLQERILSRRTLHFSDDQWYFECGEHIISEDGWHHEGRVVKSHTTPSLRASIEDATLAIGKVFQSEENYTPQGAQKGSPTPYTEVLWAQILRAYSKCSLTFWTDKGPALQGLANRFAELVNAEYHYGHWIKANVTLPLSLMWYAHNDGGLDLETDLDAPSWSCLKGNGPVGFHDCRGATPVSMLVEITASHGNLLVRGRVRTAKLAMPNGENPPYKPTYYSMSFLNKTQYGTFSNTLGPVRFDDKNTVPKDFSLLFTFEKMPYDSRYHNNQKDQLALVLVELGADEVSKRRDVLVDSSPAKRYKRIGVACVNNHTFFEGVGFSEVIIV